MSIIGRGIADTLIEWSKFGKVIVLSGARQVGKTTILGHIFRKQSKNVLWLNADLQYVREQLADNSLENLNALLDGYDYLIIDEVQRIKNAGLLLKIIYDNFPDVQVLATDSSSLEISETIFEPLTGRHLMFHLPPLSMKELYPKMPDFEMQNAIKFHLQYGCYPEVCTKKKQAEILLTNLSNQYLYKDVLIWKDIRKPELLDKLLKLLALQIGSEVSLHELGKQLKVKSETVENYIDLLEKSFVIFRLKAFSNNPRKEISKMDKIYFWDVGIRNAIIQDFNPIESKTDKGQIFENFVIAERMKVYINDKNKPDYFFWRNYNKSEVDLIEQSKDAVTAIEIKWNTHKKHKVTRAFTNDYPKANTKVITPKNLGKFIR